MNKIFLLLTIVALSFFAFSFHKANPYSVLKINGLPDSANLVAAGDLYGGPAAEFVSVTDSVLRIFTVNGSAARLLFEDNIQGDILKMHIADADNDGLPELLVMTGARKAENGSDVRIYLIKNNKGKWNRTELYSRFSTRPQPVYLNVADMDNDNKNEIIASYFESKYMVETIVLGLPAGATSWKVKKKEVERLATSRDIGKISGSKQNDYIIGRVYGDTIGQPGDAYIAGDTRTNLPVFRGVKAIRIGDADNNGKNEIYIADGWHQNFGKIARGRLAVITRENQEFKYRLIEDTKDQYEVSQIEIADIDGDRRNELVTRGNKYFRVYRYKMNKWEAFSDTSIGNSPFVISDVNGDKKAEVIFAGHITGKKTAIRFLNFGRMEFSDDLGQEVITEDIQPASLVNKPARELRMSKWVSGTFSGIQKNKGKVILLDFWATWCGPCKKMFPTLKGLNDKYAKDGLVILGLTKTDNSQSVADIDAFVKKEKFAYPIGISEEAFNNLNYGVSAIPHTVLIDKKGILRYYEIGNTDGKKLEDQIGQLLKE